MQGRAKQDRKIQGLLKQSNYTETSPNILVEVSWFESSWKISLENKLFKISVLLVYKARLTIELFEAKYCSEYWKQYRNVNRIDI